MAESNDLTWEADNNFIPKYIPGDLKWYEKDGLDTWYLRNKCEDFLKNTNLHFAKRKVVNFDMIKNQVGKETKTNIRQQTMKKQNHTRSNIKSKFAHLYSEPQIEKTCFLKRKP